MGRGVEIRRRGFVSFRGEFERKFFVIGRKGSYWYFIVTLFGIVEDKV